MAPVSVLVVEDMPELRSVVRQALRLSGRFEVVAEAADGATAIEAAAEHQPDVIVLDLGLPDVAGHEVLTHLRAIAPNAQVVVFTGGLPQDPWRVPDRADAFVTKDQGVSYLVDLLAKLSQRPPSTDMMTLGPDLADVAAGRHFLADRCAHWGCADLVDDAVLVVSELVTNAIIHGGTRCVLRVGFTGRALRLHVTDQGGGMPDPQVAGAGDEHGRGLLLISVLCLAWGVEALPGGGKVVWAELIRAA